jgi:hypothetical protein
LEVREDGEELSNCDVNLTSVNKRGEARRIDMKAFRKQCGTKRLNW